MSAVCGVDGCKGGWLLLMKDLDSKEIKAFLAESVNAIVKATLGMNVVAIDIPIGLPDKGSRQCDRIARRLLGARGVCVFPAPIRSVLSAKDYQDACSRHFKKDGLMMSKQAWGITPKVREIDTVIRINSKFREKVSEVHPEVCFYRIAGNPMPHSKKSSEGFEERHKWIQSIYGDYVGEIIDSRSKFKCKKDDILDAFAALWTAERIYNDTVVRIPQETERDRFNLKMEIVY